MTSSISAFFSAVHFLSDIIFWRWAAGQNKVLTNCCHINSADDGVRYKVAPTSLKLLGCVTDVFLTAALRYQKVSLETFSSVIMSDLSASPSILGPHMFLSLNFPSSSYCNENPVWFLLVQPLSFPLRHGLILRAWPTSSSRCWQHKFGPCPTHPSAKSHE